LTSDIEPDASVTSNPQEWLDALDLEGLTPPNVHFATVIVGNAFFKKIYLQCDKHEDILELATMCRSYGVEKGDDKAARKWVKGQYDPHCSLL